MMTLTAYCNWNVIVEWRFCWCYRQPALLKLLLSKTHLLTWLPNIADSCNIEALYMAIQVSINIDNLDKPWWRHKWKHFRVIFPLCGEFTGQGLIPLTKVIGAELWWVFYLHLNKRLSKKSVLILGTFVNWTSYLRMCCMWKTQLNQPLFMFTPTFVSKILKSEPRSFGITGRLRTH